jgi:hypothetical protein
MKWLRKLLGIRTPEEDWQAGRDYVDSVVAEHRGDSKRMNELWYQCDGGFDSSCFDRGMRNRLHELCIPDPMDMPL